MAGERKTKAIAKIEGIPASEDVGICVKDQDQNVQFQNDACKHHCGDQGGKRCEKGCMRFYKRAESDAVFELGIRSLKNVPTDVGVADMVVINDGKHLITIFQDKRLNIERQTEVLGTYGLSKTELKVAEKMLRGLSNQQIADELFVSLSTVKTHIHSIYKKIPNKISAELIAASGRKL